MAIATPGCVQKLWPHDKLFQNLVTATNIVSHLVVSVGQESGTAELVFLSASLTRLTVKTLSEAAVTSRLSCRRIHSKAQSCGCWQDAVAHM